MHGSKARRRAGAPGRLAAALAGAAPFALIAPLAASAAPFFSEYVEGSSNNKALEIYNPDAAAYDLTGCQIRMYFNGSSSHSTSSLHTFGAASIPAQGVYVLAPPNASIASQPYVNGTTSFTAWYNGDDAVALVCGGATLDVIGDIGFDPGTQWGTDLASTADNTMRRKSSVTSGDTNGSDDFIPAAEWDGYAVDTFSGLGSHSAGAADTTAPAIAGSVPAPPSSSTSPSRSPPPHRSPA